MYLPAIRSVFVSSRRIYRCQFYGVGNHETMIPSFQIFLFALRKVNRCLWKIRYFWIVFCCCAFNRKSFPNRFSHFILFKLLPYFSLVHLQYFRRVCHVLWLPKFIFVAKFRWEIIIRGREVYWLIFFLHENTWFDSKFNTNFFSLKSLFI